MTQNIPPKPVLIINCITSKFSKTFYVVFSRGSCQGGFTRSCVVVVGYMQESLGFAKHQN